MPMSSTTDGRSAVAGNIKRCTSAMPPSDPQWMREFREFTALEVLKFTPFEPDTHLSVLDWLETTSYTAREKEKLLKDYLNSPHPCDDPRFNDVGQFVKLEKFPEFKAPRLINAKKNPYKCHFGPFVKLVEQQVYSNPEFIKHVPVKQRPAYIRDRIGGLNRKYLTSDFTSFEANISTTIMRWVENKLIRRFFERHPLYRKVDWLCQSIEGAQICKSRLGYSMEVDGTRMSGEMSTSLSNGFTNLMIMKFVLHKFGITDVRIVVEGDDALISVPADATLPTALDFAKLGLKVKLEEHEQLSTASFCGLVFDETDLVNITDPIESILEMCMLSDRCHKMKHTKKMAYLKSKAMSAKYQYNGCPIIDAFASRILRLTTQYDVRVALRNTETWKRGILTEAIADRGKWKVRTVSPINTRLLMEQLYGISVATQKHLERLFDEANDLLPWFDPMFYSMTSPHHSEAWDICVRPTPPPMPRTDTNDLPMPTGKPKLAHLGRPPPGLRHLFNPSLTGWSAVP